MTAPTVAVTAKLSSFGGPALAGVVITATSDKDDIYQGLILRKTVTATTDTNGEAVFNLFPNALATAALPGLGTTGSTYRFTASVPNGWRMDVRAQVPNTACDLHSIVMADDADLPTPGEVAGAVRYDIAQTLTSPQQAQARANIGFDAAVRAVALTGLSLATATAVTAADTVLVALGKAQAQITALDAAKANLSGAAFSGAVSAPGFTGPLTGNASTATALATARNINGVSFNGSADITITAAAGTLTGTTLAANVTSASLDSITPPWWGLSVTGIQTITANSWAPALVVTQNGSGYALTVSGAASFGGAVSATGFTGPLTGNVTGNVSGSAGSVAASAITGTTLAANVVTSSLTAVGTIATGVWQGTAIADTYLATISTGGKVANSATTATSANTASAIVARDASGNFTAGTITAALSGNASTATTLATARNINGVAFNGSADITVTAAAGTLTGTTLAANVVNASLNSITPTGGTLTNSGALTSTGLTTLGSSSLTEIAKFNGTGTNGAYVTIYDAANAATRGYIGYGATLSGGALSEMVVRAQGELVFMAQGLLAWKFDSSRNLLPLVDNSFSLGNGSFRPSVLYAATGSINTSDERLKTPLRPLTSAELAAGLEIAKLGPGVFQFLDAVEEKGADRARLHVGYTVQSVIAIMQKHGLDPARYAFICYDRWDADVVHHPAVQARAAVPAQPAVYEERMVDVVIRVNGEDRAAQRPVLVEVQPAVAAQPAVEAREAYTETVREAGDRYSFRPDQLDRFINAAVIQAAIERLGL